MQNNMNNTSNMNNMKNKCKKGRGILYAASALLLVFSFLIFAASCGNKNEDGGQNGDNTGEVDAPQQETSGAAGQNGGQGDSSDGGGNGEERVSFFAAGDNIIHECVYLDAMSAAASLSSGDDYFFDNMYSNVRDDISRADVAFINAEGPLDPDARPSGYPNFNAPREAGDALVNVGFDIINLANNHMLDFNRGVGMQGTIDYWKTKDVVTVGAYESEDDYNDIRVIEKNGIKISILSYTYGTNGNSLGTDTPSLYIPYIDDSEIERQISEAKKVSDAVVVSMHWGEENSFEPSGEQKRLAGLIADCGASVIIGHHSHTIQPMEWLEGKSGNKTLVMYSLGNFLHTQVNSKNLVGAFVNFDIVIRDGEVIVENPVFTPTVCHYTANTNVLDSLDYYKRENILIYKLSDYTESLAGEHGCQYWTPFTLDTLKGYVRDTVDPEFLPEG